MVKLGQLIHPGSIKLGPPQSLIGLRAKKRSHGSIGPNQLTPGGIKFRTLPWRMHRQKSTHPLHHNMARIHIRFRHQGQMPALLLFDPVANGLCPCPSFPKPPPRKNQPHMPVTFWNPLGRTRPMPPIIGRRHLFLYCFLYYLLLFSHILLPTTQRNPHETKD